MSLQTNGQTWVVLVEDDEVLERELAQALERALPVIALQRTADADAALQLVHDERSCVLITEAQGKWVDGIALAACARRRRPMLPLVFLSEPRSPARRRAAEFEGSHVLDKPPELQRLITLVARILDPRAGFRGELESHDLSELVQLVAVTMPTGCLQLWTSDAQGSIWLEQGMIVHASCGGEQGAPAFQRMIGWQTGSFSIAAGASPPTRSIGLTTTQLLLESVRILDEQGVQERPERSGTLPVFRTAAEHFERGLEAVQGRRYADALPEWERAAEIEPNHRVYQHNLRRLRALLARGGERRVQGGSR